VHLISDFVIELLETLDIPVTQIEELVASMELVKTLDRPEDMMVHLSGIARQIINGETPSELRISEPSLSQVRLQAAKMTRSYLALLS
jgi:hydroxypyruvate isomerase